MHSDKNIKKKLQKQQYFDRIFERYKDKKIFAHWCWPAAIFTSLWLAYRRAYKAAAIILLLEVTLLSFLIFSPFCRQVLECARAGFSLEEAVASLGATSSAASTNVLSLMIFILKGFFLLPLYRQSWIARGRPPHHENTSKMALWLWLVLETVVTITAAVICILVPSCTSLQGTN